MDTFALGVVVGGSISALITVFFRMRDLARLWKHIQENDLALIHAQELAKENQRLIEVLRERLNAQKTDTQWRAEYTP